MTLEKLKRESYASNQYKMSRRKARKIIRKEREIERLGIKAGFITRKTRFVCNHCQTILKHSEWLREAGGVIRCPKCLEETMDICFTARIELKRGIK